MNKKQEIKELAETHIKTRFDFSPSVNFKPSEYGYSFELSNMIADLGNCDFKRKKIQLNEGYALDESTSKGEIIDMLLHEIAHAAVFEKFNRTGHCDLWKTKCRILGANPDRENYSYEEWQKKLIEESLGFTQN